MAILGDNTQGAAQFPDSEDRALLQLVTATEAGTINSGHAYFGASSTAGMNAKVCLYTDAGGIPGTQVAVSSAASVPAGSGLVNFTMSGSFTATTYYLGIVADGFYAYLSEDDGLSGQDLQMANGTFSYASPPGSWPGTDATYTNARINVYLDYTAGGGGGGGQPITARLGGTPYAKAGPRHPGRTWKQRLSGIIHPDIPPSYSFVSFLLPDRFA